MDTFNPLNDNRILVPKTALKTGKVCLLITTRRTRWKAFKAKKRLRKQYPGKRFITIQSWTRYADKQYDIYWVKDQDWRDRKTGKTLAELGISLEK